MNSQTISSKNIIFLTNLNKNNNLQKNGITLRNERFHFLDWLRIICSFSIILIHVAAQKWYVCPIKSHEWKIFSFYNGIARFGVPIFFMISGTIFFEKNISFSIMIKRYIKRIIIHLIFWSFFYSLRKKILNNHSYKYTFILFLDGYYHLWFLFRISGLYLITPFLKEINENEKFTLFLISNFIFGFLFRNLLSFLFYYSKDYYNIINKINEKIALNGFFNDNIFYYMFGFYLNKKKLRPFLRSIIYILGICGMIFTFKMTYYVSIKKNNKIGFYSPYYINIFFTSIAIFIFFKYNFNDLKYKKRIKEFIQKLASLTFGIYIIHPFVIEELNIRIKLNSLSFEPLYSIPTNSLLIFLISSLIVYFFKFIPFIKQYIF